jgi:hypothetical protein
MAVGAYILIQTEVGQASDVAAKVGRLPGVSSVDAVAGPYDVISRAEADTIDALGRFVVGRCSRSTGNSHLTSPIVVLDRRRPIDPPPSSASGNDASALPTVVRAQSGRRGAQRHFSRLSIKVRS